MRAASVALRGGRVVRTPVDTATHPAALPDSTTARTGSLHHTPATAVLLSSTPRPLTHLELQAAPAPETLARSGP